MRLDIPYRFADDEYVTIERRNANFLAVQRVLNGGLDGSNISPGTMLSTGASPHVVNNKHLFQLGFEVATPDATGGPYIRGFTNAEPLSPSLTYDVVIGHFYCLPYDGAAVDTTFDVDVEVYNVSQSLSVATGAIAGTWNDSSRNNAHRNYVEMTLANSTGILGADVLRLATNWTAAPAIYRPLILVSLVCKAVHQA